MKIEAASQELLHEFCSRISYSWTPSLRGIALADSGVVQAVVGFDSWTPNSAQMHVWCGGRVTRAFIKECLRYLFVTCNKGLAIGVTPGDNKDALNFNRRIGFQILFEVPNAWKVGTSMVIQQLRREDCKWLRGSDGQEYTASS